MNTKIAAILAAIIIAILPILACGTADGISVGCARSDCSAPTPTRPPWPEK